VRAREKAEKPLGAKFNVRAFHDAVLEVGSVPLPVVTTRVDRFPGGFTGHVAHPGRSIRRVIR
jgi:uncharacterized protein (DUF885 family)